MADDVQRKPSAALRLILIASLVLLLLAAGAEWLERWPQAPGSEVGLGPDDRVIMPGQRVGPITLGLSARSAEAVLGRAEIRPQEGILLHVYEQHGLSLAVKDGRVLSIVVKDPRFQTRDGIGVGTDVDRAVRAYGEHYEWEGKSEAYVLHYWAAGIHLRVEKTIVVSIQITEPMVSRGKSFFWGSRCRPAFPS
ncbi:MAG: hypothetical protein HY319_02595 [Armatimonadetes bacterium]|nr:hypothetical protein [Armatimonadota bacterium]